VLQVTVELSSATQQVRVLAMLLVRAVTFEITGVLVCMSVPLGKVYGDALRHYRLPCPDDSAMKSAFKRAYGGVGTELPNFGAAESPPMPERVWWDRMIRATLSEAGCEEALQEEVFPLVLRRVDMCIHA